MSRNNRFRFSYQDLSRVVFEHKLNEQNIIFRLEEQLDNYVVPNTPLYIYYISDEDYPQALDIYKSISSEDDPEYAKHMTRIALFFIITTVLFWLFMNYLSMF